MAHQIVATSVPRGLDGVSGYQTVLKSAGIPPRVFDRLKARSGYSHHYPHGDSRNPIIYLHRIEELAGIRWHVLGCIRDAGSDHTGRSNFLAHMLGIDSGEARGKPAGPAAVAISSGCFLEKWIGPPDSAAPTKTVIASDRLPQPGDAPAWAAAGLDPGLAGDLAAAAMANRKVVLVTRPSDDVLALFADALRLVDPSRRWGVTFNTCAIEEFDGIWKAIRVDLAHTHDMRSGRTAFIDLTARPHGSTDPYALFARGQIDCLPWQRQPVLAEPVKVLSNESSIAKTNFNDGTRTTTKHFHRRRKSVEQLGVERRRTRRPRYEEAEEPSRSPWVAISIAVAGCLLLSALAVFPFRDQILSSLRPTEQPRPALVRGREVPTVRYHPQAAEESPEYRQATLLKDARAALEAGVNGVTHSSLRHEADTLLDAFTKLEKDFPNEWSMLKPKDDSSADLGRRIESVIKACKGVAQVLETSSNLQIEDVTRSTAEFKAAVNDLASLQEQVAQLRDKLTSHRSSAEKKDLLNQQIRALESLKQLRRIVPLDPAQELAGLGDGDPNATQATREFDLGSFPAKDLLNLKFRIAVPRDKANNDSYFKAAVVKVNTEGREAWEVQYTPSVVNLEGDKSKTKPKTLISLKVRDGKLFLEAPNSNSNELMTSYFALLRRSVILVEATDPRSLNLPPFVQQEIRFVEPKEFRPLAINLDKRSRETCVIELPSGIMRTGESTHGKKGLPALSLRVELDITGDNEGPYVIRRPHVKDAGESEAGTADVERWASPLINTTPDCDFGIEAKVTLTLSTANIAVDVAFCGPGYRRMGGMSVKEFKTNLDNNFRHLIDDQQQRVIKAFVNAFKPFDGSPQGDQAKSAPKIDPVTQLKKTFEMPLPPYVKMPGHETAKNSFCLFLKEKKSTDFDGWIKQLAEAKTNGKDCAPFIETARSGWGIWFWPQYEAQLICSTSHFKEAFGKDFALHGVTVTSLAYDDMNNEYQVPLVVCAEPDGARPNEQGVTDQPLGVDGSGPLESATSAPRSPKSGGAVGPQ